MFEAADGSDVFQQFSAQGASSNAFTSFTQTSYLFSATEDIMLNLQTLLDFVQDPHFTKESVEKEKGIIGQEIQMYRDDASWRQFFGMIENLFPNHPVSIDIAGTIDSIAPITVEDLYTSYRTFYHPSNMILFVVGNLNPQEMMNFIRENQASKEFAPAVPIQRRFPEIKQSDIIKERSVEMNVTRPKFTLGLLGTDEVPTNGRELLAYKFSARLLFEMLFGPTSHNYLTLYNEGIIDDTFDTEFNLERGFHFADFGGDSDQPKEALERVESLLLDFENSPELTEASLSLLKKKMLGKYLQSLNSLEYIANQFSQSLFGETTLFDFIEVLEGISLDQVLTVGKKFIKEENLSRFYIHPKTK
jgi:predicted Zn-dependent peptidase